jgi:hypothetical protein
MYLVTVMATLVAALGGLGLAATQATPAASDPGTWLVAVAGTAALAGWARMWAESRASRRRLESRLHDLAMVRLLRPRMG